MNTAHFKTCSCGGRLRCTDSRSSDAGGIPHIRRRYRCPKCERTITTAEFVMPERDGRNTPVYQRFMKTVRSEAIADLKRQINELA